MKWQELTKLFLAGQIEITTFTFNPTYSFISYVDLSGNIRTTRNIYSIRVLLSLLPNVLHNPVRDTQHPVTLMLTPTLHRLLSQQL